MQIGRAAYRPAPASLECRVLRSETKLAGFKPGFRTWVPNLGSEPGFKPGFEPGFEPGLKPGF